MSWPRRIGELVEIIRMGVEELSVEWRIQNFQSLSVKSDDWCDSPQFRIGKERFQLSIWPNWRDDSRRPASRWVGLCLGRRDGGKPKDFRFIVGIRGSRGVERMTEEYEMFSDEGHNCFISYFCLRSELMEHRTRLMPDGVLTIMCVLNRGAGRGVLSLPFTQAAPTNRSQFSNKRDVSTQTDCNLEAEVLTEVKKSSEKKGCEKVHEDFARLLASGEDSDVTVQVGDVEFKVHRAILSVRSSVFSAMFRHETEERASNNIKIDDCEPDTFGEYLQYLYTGSIQTLTEQTVFGLYRIADKYLAEDLKQL